MENKITTYAQFFQQFLRDLWNFLFQLEFTIDGFTVSFGQLFVYSFMFVIGVRIISVLVNSYDHDN